jgi:KDO2-lipid IV(A) lauroyltransferase
VNRWIAQFGVWLINLTQHWSQRTRSRVAHALSDLIWWLAWPRRHVTLANLRACFPQKSEAERKRLGRLTFRSLARAALDHSVLWNADRAMIERYVRVEGEQYLLDPANRPIVVIAPHFAGLDAGGVRANTLVRGASIYSRQKNPVWDDWLLKARKRFSDPVLIPRQGIDMRSVVRIVREGLPLYYLPDMDLGPTNSIFVPFLGVQTATIPMVSRIARMTGARVIMAVTEMTEDGYVLHFEAPWEDFPGASIEEDTARMNREIERWVLRMPTQYFWTHKRFKTRPDGEPSLY